MCEKQNEEKRDGGEGEGKGRSCYCGRKYEPVLRGDCDMHSAVMCARVRGWGCARLCQNVQEMEREWRQATFSREGNGGWERQSENRNRQTEGRRASGAARVDGSMSFMSAFKNSRGSGD